MKKTATHTINQAVFQFDYEGRKAALRCNAQIEEAYESQIFPVMQETIANGIPEEASLSIEKLEIDLGYLREKELMTMLLDRLRSALNLELVKSLAIRHSTEDFSGDTQKRFTAFTNDAIALFMSKGYFPHWIKPGFTMQQLVEKSIQQRPEHFLEMLHRYATDDRAIKRLIHHTTPGLIQDVVARLAPTESDWINNYRKWLLSFFKSHAFFGIAEKRLSFALDFYMLQYVLRRNSLLFDRAQFSAFVLDGLSNTLNLSLETYNNALFTTRPPILDDISFYKLVKAFVQTKQLATTQTLAQDDYASEKIIGLLNKGFTHLTAQDQDQLRIHSIKLLGDSQELKKYSARLSEKGWQALIALNYNGDVSLVFKLVQRFATLSKAHLITDTTTAKAVMILKTLDYLKANPNPPLITPVYIAYLADALKLNDDVLKSKAFQEVLKELPIQNTIATQDVVAVDKAALTKVKQTIGLSLNTDSPILHQDRPPAFKTQQALLLSYRDVVVSYLQTGILQSKNSITYLSEIQMQFTYLIAAEDQFLVHLINKGKQPELILKRIQKIYDLGQVQGLYQYLIKYFPKALARFESYVSPMTSAQTRATSPSRFSNTLMPYLSALLKALLNSQGGLYPKTFEFMAHQSIMVFLKAQQKVSNAEKISLHKKELENIRKSEDFEREIVEAFIVTGQQRGLANTNDLSPLRRSFHKRLEKKDAFFSHILTDMSFERGLYERILALISPPVLAATYSYMDHYFPNEVRSLKQIVKSLSRFRESVNSNLDAASLSQTSGHLSAGIPQNTLTQMSYQAIIYAILHRNPTKEYAHFEVVLYAYLEEELNILYPEIKQQNLGSTTPTNAKTTAHFDAKTQDNTSGLDPERIADDRIKTPAQLDPNEAVQKSIPLKTTEKYRNVDKTDKSVKVPILGLEQEDKNTKEAAANVSEAVPSILLGIKFYITHGFWPWWSEMAALANVVDKVASLDPKALATFVKALEVWLNDQLMNKTNADKAQQEISQNRHTRIFELRNLLHTKNQITVTLEQPLTHTDRPLAQTPIPLSKIHADVVWDQSLIYELLYHNKDLQLLKAYWGTFTNGQHISSQYLTLGTTLAHYGIKYSSWRTAFFTFLLQRPLAKRKKHSNRFDSSLLHFLTTRYSDIAWSSIFVDIYRRSRQEINSTLAKLPEGLEHIVAKKAKERHSQITKPNTDDFMEEEITIAIPNAGLIILGAYLPQYFERLGLIENGSFIDVAAQNRGVYLLQYLGFESIDFSEYDLVLNKLLVGMPLDELVTPIAAVTQEEKDLSTSLLMGVINNWERMQNTTPSGLRETFLQREGLLKLKEEYSELYIERKGLDILLEGIPWNITTLNLSWMDKPLQINW